MHKKYWSMLAAGIALGAWHIYRDRKYPVCHELRFANKLVIPGFVLQQNTARLANQMLSRMEPSPPPQGIARRIFKIPSEDGREVRLSVYRPENMTGPCPCLVYFHGGGFCLEDADYIHRYAAQYAQGAQCIVAFVHYRTSDIAPFPTPFQDCCTALRWLWINSGELDIDRKRIAVGGDSAGGALAAACALQARDKGGPQLCFQLLIYPVTDCRMKTASMRRYTDSPLWNAMLSQKMWNLYLREGSKGLLEYAAPMLARNFSGLPPAYVEVEEFDCLRDEGIAYAQALQSAGIPVQLERVSGTFHGFDFFADKKISQIMIRKRVKALQQEFYG